MTVVEHLQEFRYRLVASIVAFVVATIVAYALYGPLLRLLKSPLDAAGSVGGFEIRDLYVPGITTAFVLRVKVAAFAGVVLALPVILYHFWRFITPGLQPRERRFTIPFVVSSLGLFALGSWFAFLILPTGIRFLLGFTRPEEGVKPFIFLTEYLNFIFLMVIAFGITFEFPLVLVFLAAVGMIDSRKLRSWRRYAFFLVFLVAAIATPSQDPLSQVMMAGPLYVLYETSILVIRFALKK